MKNKITCHPVCSLQFIFCISFYMVFSFNLYALKKMDLQIINNGIFNTQSHNSPEEKHDNNNYDLNQELSINLKDSNYYSVYDSLIKKASQLMKLGKKSDAITLYNQLIETAENEKNSEKLTAIYLNLGLLYYNLNQTENSLKYYYSALDVCDSVTDYFHYAETFHGLAINYFDLGKFHKAYSLYLKSLKFYKYGKDSMIIGSMYNNLGTCMQNINKYDSATIYFRKSEHYLSKIRNKKEISCLFHNIGLNYFYLHVYDSALYYSRLSLNIQMNNTDYKNKAIGHNLISEIYYELGNYHESLAESFLALECSKQSSYPYVMDGVYLQISKCYESLNDPIQALQYYKLYSEMKDSIHRIETSKKISDMETNYLSQKTQAQLDNQKLKIKYQENILKKQRSQKIAALSGFIFILILFIIIYRNYQEKKANVKLEKQKDQIKCMSEEMRKVDKMKIDYFTNISHELRTPLSVILGLSEELCNLTFEEKENKKMQVVRKNTLKLVNLVNQMLELRKIDSGEMRVHLTLGDLAAFISRVCMMLESLADQKKTTILFRSYKEKIIGYFDPDKLEKIIINLLSNAIKFSKKNGKIIIILNKDKNDTSFIIIDVIDEGIGIPQDEASYIFKPFFQASNNNHGSGIGLALTKEMIELMNGSIHVDSKLNTGTRFSIRLPIEKKNFKNHVNGSNEIREMLPSVDNQYIKMLLEENFEVNEYEKDAEEYINKTGREQSILIVEDNSDLREYIRNTLKEFHTIYTAANGEKGLEIAISKIPDIIISDVMMPNMNGLEMCKRIKNDERTSHIPVILLTAKSGDDNIILGMEQGADDYIVKPFNIELLKVKIINLIDTRKKLQEKFSKNFVLEPEIKDYSGPDQRFIQKLHQVIEQNIDNPEFDVMTLTEYFPMSRSQLYRKIKALTNITVKEYINAYRLRKGAELLKEEEIHIAEVSYRVGFGSPSYFTKCFKQHFGVTPKEYCTQRV